MKKTFFIMAFVAMFIAGCSGSPKKGKIQSAEITEIERLISTTDSVATEIEQTTVEIKESAAAVDSLLNEL